MKDLRTDYETGNVEAVLDGDLDAFMEAELRRQRRSDRRLTRWRARKARRGVDRIDMSGDAALVCLRGHQRRAIAEANDPHRS